MNITLFMLSVAVFAEAKAHEKYVYKESDDSIQDVLLSLAADPSSIYRDEYEKVVVSTSKGRVRGFLYPTPQGSKGLVFQGVPFAEPPLGSLRFAKPIERKPWNGILDAFEYEAACIQIRPPIKMPDITSEDCLYLNIYAPVDALQGDKHYPVVYYTFGGAMDFGSPRIFEPKYLIDNFITQGIIFVTTNYRLGALSYFSTGTSDAPGNLQLQDIIQGLRWTNDEIHNFGGDKSQITIMGHSSGAMNTVHLTLTPLTEGLYKQALIMSGPAIMARSLNNDLSWYKNTADAIGCGASWSTGDFAAAVDCMRNADPQNITDAYNHLKLPEQASASRIDGDVFSESLESLASKRRPTHYLSGTASNEAPWGLRSFPAPTRAAIRKHCNSTAVWHKSSKILEPCVYFYDVQQRGRDEKNFDFMNQRLRLLDSDNQYYGPVFLDADYMRKAGGTVYLYNFEYVKKGTEELAVFHAMDLYYIFGYPYLGGYDEEDSRIGKLYSSLFGNFIKYGNPTPNQPEDPTAGMWEPLQKPTGFNYYRIDRNSSTEEFYHFDPVQFWDEIIPYIED